MDEFTQAILQSPVDQAARILRDQPMLMWVLEQALLATANNRLLILGGLGVDDRMIVLPDSRQAQQNLYMKTQLARSQPPASWHGFDVRHLTRQSDSEFNSLDVLAALDSGRKWLTQPLFDFLTLRDSDHILMSMLVVQDGSGAAGLMHYSEDDFRLASAFRKQLVDEAKPHRQRVAAGVYIMDRTPMPYLDQQLIYETARLVIHPQGIFASFIARRPVSDPRPAQNMYIPFFWTPGGVNTSQVWVHPRAVFALDVCLAAMWRDACIVREKWADRQPNRRTEFKVAKPSHDNPVMLPRTVYHSAWGSSDERDYIEKHTRKAHAVRGSYVELPEGQQAHDAEERAAEFFYPAPPDGYTFRRPHTRGDKTDSIDGVQPRRVVCRGLQTAKIVLG